MLSLREFINENFDNYEKFRNHTCTFNPGARPILNGKYSVHTEKAMPGKMYYKVKHKNKEIGSF